jgi:hypothetical protein
VVKGGVQALSERVLPEENLDGKYPLRTADPKLSAEDIATCARSTTGAKTASAPPTANFRMSTAGFTDYATTSAAEPR